jgi:hypothetical protein
MTPKKFVLIFFSSMTLLVAAVFAVTYFDIQKYNTAEETIQSITLPEKKPAASMTANSYSRDEYPLPRGESGILKNIDTAKNEIIAAANGNEYRALITPTTEVFRDGKKTSLENIKISDKLAILGREKAKGSELFVADSIYANSANNDIAIDLTPKAADGKAMLVPAVAMPDPQ